MANKNEGKAEGGRNSGGNFKNDPQRAAEAGRKGGQQSQSDEGDGKQQGGENLADESQRGSEVNRKGGQE